MNFFEETMDKIEKNGRKVPLNILFVCSGNICRSAYADFAFRRMVENSNILRDKIKVQSGALQIKNETIDPRTKKFLIEEGFVEGNVDKHEPKYIKEHEKLFQKADLIIGMTNGHKLATPKRFRSKFQQLSKLAEEKKVDIEDPYWTKNYNEFREILKSIRHYLKLIKNKLENHFL
ncbi:MAG: arsenate-mycothiol transferase ArsC [Promethearchaeota archaeon]